MEGGVGLDKVVQSRVEKETFRPLDRPEGYDRVEDRYGRG